MQEFSIATKILEDVLAFSEALETPEVSRVRLEIGRFMDIDVNQLLFCYDSIKQMTPVKNSFLDVEFVADGMECVITDVHLLGAPGSQPFYLFNSIPTPERDAFHDAIHSEI